MEIGIEEFIIRMKDAGLDDDSIEASTIFFITMERLVREGYCFSLSSEKSIKNIQDALNADVTIKKMENGQRFDLKAMLWFINEFVAKGSVVQ